MIADKPCRGRRTIPQTVLFNKCDAHTEVGSAIIPVPKAAETLRA